MPKDTKQNQDPNTEAPDTIVSSLFGKKKKKKTAEGTATSLVVQNLKKHNAVSEETAIPIADFKNVKLSTTTLAFTLANLIEQGVVVQTKDEKYYYDDMKFKEIEKNFLKGYSMIIIIPLVFVVLFLLLRAIF